MFEHAHHHRNGRKHVCTIDAELLFQQMRSGRRVTIVDVRSSTEFHRPTGHVPGAISIPLAQLFARAKELDSSRAIPLVVVSGEGDSSRLGVLELELAGFNEVSSLEGGMRRWRELALPIEQHLLKGALADRA